VLYADTVTPARLPASGGPIVIHGMGFRLADTVLVGGQPAVVTSISPTEITAIAPAAANGVTGSVNVEVDDLPTFSHAAIFSGALSYDSGSADALTLNSAPTNTIPIGVPVPFTVTALGSNLAPAGGVTVYSPSPVEPPFSPAAMPVCPVTTTGDGRATIQITAIDGTWSVVTASLTNGSTVQSEFMGGTPPVLAVAHTAAIARRRSHLQLDRSGSGACEAACPPPASPSPLHPTVPASARRRTPHPSPTSTVSPPQRSPSVRLTEGQTATINACLNGTSQCVTLTAFGARPEFASLAAVSGTTNHSPSNRVHRRSPSAFSTWTAIPWPADQSISTRPSMPGPRPAPHTASVPKRHF
jgi:hypothetical protein